MCLLFLYVENLYNLMLHATTITNVPWLAASYLLKAYDLIYNTILSLSILSGYVWRYIYLHYNIDKLNAYTIIL